MRVSNQRAATAATASLPFLLLLIGAHHGLLSTSAEAFATPVVAGRSCHGRPLFISLKDTPPSTLHASSATALALSGGSHDDVSTKSTPKNALSREMMAEFIGTYLLVQIVCGVVCAATYLGAQVGLWQIAAAWSVAVTLAISTTA